MTAKKKDVTDPETCASCRFFLCEEPKEDAGYCRRNPPAWVGDEHSGGYTFPVLVSTDWCGEYKRRVN
jgi:hypothetical protein